MLCCQNDILNFRLKAIYQMTKVIVIIGLPGSGKSTLGKKLSKELGIPFFDDCITTEEHWNNANEALEKEEDCILSDPRFCQNVTYKLFLTKLNCDFDIEFIYFKNEPNVCKKNSQERDNKVIDNKFIDHLSEGYNPPENALPCHKE